MNGWRRTVIGKSERYGRQRRRFVVVDYLVGRFKAEVPKKAA
jgi:hypothetical protein